MIVFLSQFNTGLTLSTFVNAFSFSATWETAGQRVLISGTDEAFLTKKRLTSSEINFRCYFLNLYVELLIKSRAKPHIFAAFVSAWMEPDGNWFSL